MVCSCLEGVLSRSHARGVIATCVMLLVTLAGCTPSPGRVALTYRSPALEWARSEAVRAQDLFSALQDALRRYYVRPAVAERCVEALREDILANRFEGLEADELGVRITQRLHAVSGDAHLSVYHHPERAMQLQRDAPAVAFNDADEAWARMDNHGIPRVEVLEGNVGYVALRSLPAPTPAAMGQMHATLRWLQDVDALILDVRGNRGGSPEMAMHWVSHLLDVAEGTPLLAMDDHELGTRRTVDHVGDHGEVSLSVPVWVLMDGQTFSAAEALALVLQQRGRVEVVGEVSGGGAHAGTLLPLPGGYVLFLPMARASDAQTGLSWEGTGVVPSVVVAASEAMASAHLAALKWLRMEGDAATQARLWWAMQWARARHRPKALSRGEIERLVGEYGTRRVSLDGGRLVYQRGDGAPRRLVAIDEELLVVEGLRDVLLRVERNAQGGVVALVGLYRDGSQDRTPRTTSGQVAPHR